MELRYAEDFKVEEAVIHLISHGMGDPHYSDSPISDEEILHEFIPKHILKVLGSYENMKADFYDSPKGEEDGPSGEQGGMVGASDAVRGIFADQESLLVNSRILAKLMAESTKMFEDMAGYGFIAARITFFDKGESVKGLALMKLDNQATYAHDVEFEDDEVKINIVRNENGLPSTSQKVSNCAVIKEEDGTGYSMLVLNRKARDIEGNLVDYFVESFLGADYVMDDTSKTVNFKGTVEKWLRKAAKDDIHKAISGREVIDGAISDGMLVDVSDVIYKITDSNDEKESLEESLAVKGIMPHDKFQVDRGFIEKKMKNRQIKTNTGFVLKGERELFDDSSRFEIIYNGDGTVTYIIKNVRNITER